MAPGDESGAGALRDDLKLVAMRLGRLERRLLDHRDVLAGTLVLLAVEAIVLVMFLAR